MSTEWEQSLGDLASYDQARGDLRLLRDLRAAEEDALVEALHVMQEAWFLLADGLQTAGALVARNREAVAVLEAGIGHARDALNLSEAES